MPPPPLASASEVGALEVLQLKRLWSRALATRAGQATDRSEAHLDQLVIHALGLGLEQTLQHLMSAAPSFAEFERWIETTTGGTGGTGGIGGIARRRRARINAVVAGQPYPADVDAWLAEVDAEAPVLSAADLAHWETHGYVIVHDAVSPENREAAAQAIWNHLGARADSPESWYGPRSHGIMVQLFQHAALDANRGARRIHKAFAQLWGTADLWVTCDRVGFNAPERDGRRFPGPELHWDVSLTLPIPMGTQGVLYLTDTAADQGAFTCVPGFQHRIEGWLASLAPDADPRQQDLHALGSRAVAGRAGDLIIWHQALPHGSRPNRARLPRLVQYINLFPTKIEQREVWR